MTGQRGVALIMVILLTSFLSALGLGVILAVFMDRLATGNMSGSVAMFYAADAGIELAARELARRADWNAVLIGADSSAFTDGAASGVRDIPGGGTVDLSRATNMLNCGRPTNCSPAQMDASSRERPWGANNPRWQLFAYGPMRQFASLLRPAPCYLAVWIADDGRERDDDPATDAIEGDAPGHGIVRIHAEVCSALAALDAPLKPSWRASVRSRASQDVCRAFVCNRGRNCTRQFLDFTNREAYDRGTGKRLFGR